MPIAALALLLPMAAADQAARDPGTHFFNDTFGDFREELQTARDAGKKGILIMFEMDECPFCHYMKTRILNRPAVQDYFREHFLVFSVDIEGDIEITDFAGRETTMKDFALHQYRVRATPVFAFFDLDGGYIKRARLTGKANDHEEFMLLGRYVVEQAFRKQTFTRYKRAKR
ncbi:MAG: thioredoxin family protein [Gammaproteobacteria bacterium]|nr:thioredoxin family protein [Gammaproteobacteria bacterium]